MAQFTVASFNVKNLIGPDQEYYKFQSYTPEEYAWKQDWLADQILTLDADIVAFQEIFEEEALRDTIGEADDRALELNAAAIPNRSKRYSRKAIFRRLAVGTYEDATLVFAPNTADVKQPGQRRPGLAVLTRFPVLETEVIQDLETPLEIPFDALRGIDGDAGFFRMQRVSRPILKVRLKVGDQEIVVFNSHLKSKLGEFITPDGAAFPPETDLTQYDPVGRALGSLRSGLRRMAEAWILRREIVRELAAGTPVIAMGDYNDGEHAVSSEIISGEAPFKDYRWLLRHDAETPRDRYNAEENEQITEDILTHQLHSAEKLFVRKSMRDMVYTTAFGGAFESIDQIYLSRHFHPDYGKAIGEMEYFSVFNDHLTDGSHPEAPYNKLASDHGQIMAHMNLFDE